MGIEHRPRQGPHQIIDVAGWEVDPDNPYYPEGKQPKKLLISPSDRLPPFLLPTHKYLFKTPTGWQEKQIWSELIAYELSRAVGVSVPPCFLARDSSEGHLGVLVEFFYGYKGEELPRFIPGSDFVHAWLSSNYDRKRGRPHAVRANLTIARSLGISNYKEWWANAFLFDAIIGNVDRHPDNWGLLASAIVGNNFNYSMAPLFDNGSSLSYGEPDDQLARYQDLDAYIRRGRHHCAWDGGPKGDRHVELCKLFFETYKPAGVAEEFMIRFTNDAIDDVLGWCRNFESPVEFSAVRADFLRALMIRRRELLTALCADNA
ncbi:HipA domain-containing protein [Rhizobium mayense]|uniref:HipA domain-containing protein n=1 Tax=Rhizobium mayense TaxID=1312184 RepID=A0ABT7JZ14_9HYPH|nr:HipA domain-containing protein [Rhizobium mayense]MDL2401589.1 HipA domain-containing protein [Rhizobium mayense]